MGIGHLPGLLGGLGLTGAGIVGHGACDVIGDKRFGINDDIAPNEQAILEAMQEAIAAQTVIDLKNFQIKRIAEELKNTGTITNSENNTEHTFGDIEEDDINRILRGEVAVPSEDEADKLSAQTSEEKLQLYAYFLNEQLKENLGKNASISNLKEYTDVDCLIDPTQSQERYKGIVKNSMEKMEVLTHVESLALSTNKLFKEALTSNKNLSFEEIKELAIRKYTAGIISRNIGLGRDHQDELIDNIRTIEINPKISKLLTDTNISKEQKLLLWYQATEELSVKTEDQKWLTDISESLTEDGEGEGFSFKNIEDNTNIPKSIKDRLKDINGDSRQECLRNLKRAYLSYKLSKIDCEKIRTLTPEQAKTALGKRIMEGPDANTYSTHLLNHQYKKDNATGTRKLWRHLTGKSTKNRNYYSETNLVRISGQVKKERRGFLWRKISRDKNIYTIDKGSISSGELIPETKSFEDFLTKERKFELRSNYYRKVELMTKKGVQADFTSPLANRKIKDKVKEQQNRTKFSRGTRKVRPLRPN